MRALRDWNRRIGLFVRSAGNRGKALWRFCQFACVGACVAVLHYAALAFMVELFGMRVVLASTIGFVIAAIVNYALNRRFTFSSSARHLVALPRFLTVAILGVTINGILVGWLEEHTTLHYLLAQMIATGTVLLWNFSLNSVWTFKGAH